MTTQSRSAKGDFLDTNGPDDVVGEVVITDWIKREVVDDILDAAFSWISYWCTLVEVKDDDWHGAEFMTGVPSRGGTLILNVDPDLLDEDQTNPFELTLDKLIFGISKACDHFGKNVTALYDNHDAITGDVVVQYALFGDVLYG